MLELSYDRSPGGNLQTDRLPMEAFESVICPIKAIMLSKPDIYFSLTGSFVFHAAEGIMNHISQIDKIPLPVKSGSAPFRPFPASIVFPLLVWFGRGGSNVLGKSKNYPIRFSRPSTTTKRKSCRLSPDPVSQIHSKIL